MYLPQERKTDLPVDGDMFNCKWRDLCTYLWKDTHIITCGEKVSLYLWIETYLIACMW